MGINIRPSEKVTVFNERNVTVFLIIYNITDDGSINLL